MRKIPSVVLLCAVVGAVYQLAGPGLEARSQKSGGIITNFIFDLSGAQEVPSVPSPATGGCMGVFDDSSMNLAMTCVFNIPVPSSVGIHEAPAGATGDVVFDLGGPASPIVITWIGLSAAEVTALFAGDLYVNVKTNGRPEGEIRGQILRRTADTYAFDLDGSQQVPPAVTTAVGTCIANLNAAATSFTVDCAHDVTLPTVAHIHEAPAGENNNTPLIGGSPVSPFTLVSPMTPINVANLLASFWYINVHSENFPFDEDPTGSPGELRGQIVGQVGFFEDGFESGDTLAWSSTVP